MNLEQLSTMTEPELHARANAHLEHVDIETESHQDKQHHVIQAQLYLAELDRRKQARESNESAKIANRDYKLERWVIVLIGAELVLAVVAILVGWVEGAKQTKVLDELNRSSAETAATLTAVRQAQEASLDTQKHTLGNIVAMNDALQDEMDLNLTGAIQWNGGGGDSKGHQVTYFGNRGRTVLSLWGSKFGNDAPRMRERPTVLAPGGSAGFDISRLMTKTGVAAEAQVSIPFELYLKRQNGTKYVAAGIVQVNQNNSVGYIGPMTTARKQWQLAIQPMTKSCCKTSTPV
jgi:hypothetical protein